MNTDLRSLADRPDLRLGDRPLVVSDVDEVVFEFLTPFSSFLKARGLQLLPRSFKLFGNIVSEDGTEIGAGDASGLLDDFFTQQTRWQTPALDAVDTLHALSADCDIVFLTAMKPHHTVFRRAALDLFGLPFPMIATEGPKGHIVRELHGGRALPVVFLDDIDRNLQSVAEEVPSCLLLRMMANEDFRKLAPPAAGGVRIADGWRHAQSLILAHCAGG